MLGIPGVRNQDPEHEMFVQAILNIGTGLCPLRRRDATLTQLLHTA